MGAAAVSCSVEDSSALVVCDDVMSDLRYGCSLPCAG